MCLPEGEGRGPGNGEPMGAGGVTPKDSDSVTVTKLIKRNVA